MNDVILWGAIFLLSAAILIAAIILLVKITSKISFLQKLSKGNNKLLYLYSALFTLAIFTILSITIGYINAFIVFVHILIFLIPVKLIQRKHKSISDDISLLSATAITTVYLLIAVFLCFNVTRKEYSLVTDKNIESLRVVLFADAHAGTTFSGKNFQKYVDLINDENPDIVVITGDLVDDSTKYQDMVDLCTSLGNLKTKYGVYYVFGNHDKGYSNPESRGFTAEDLVYNLKQNNVSVLEDDAVFINDSFYIVGRQDKSEETRGNGRQDIKTLTKNLDKNKYILVLDHQPNDYKNESESSSDLVLSGHTHGGQMLPINRIGELIKANDATYGLKKINNTNFIVTSGISDWEVYFKTGCRSEYVVINIQSK